MRRNAWKDAASWQTRKSINDPKSAHRPWMTINSKEEERETVGILTSKRLKGGVLWEMHLKGIFFFNFSSIFPFFLIF